MREKQVAYITIEGPVQSGKSIVMDRIARILEEDFGVTVASQDLVLERNLGVDSTDVAEWELEMLRGTHWVLREHTDPSENNKHLNDKSHFPILVKWTQTNKCELIKAPEDLTNKGSFKLVATQVIVDEQ